VAYLFTFVTVMAFCKAIQCSVVVYSFNFSWHSH